MTTSCFITDDPVADDFFPDVHDLLDDMAGEDTDPKSSAVPYVFLSFLLKVLPQFIVLVLVLHMLGLLHICYSLYCLL